MAKLTRTVLPATAAVSLVALTACGQGAEDTPALSEIESQMWETMQAQETVTITADLEDLSGDPMFEEMFGGEDANMQIYGALDGSATAMSLGDTDLVRVFDQEAYFSGDAMFEMIGSAGAAMGGEDANMEGLVEEFSGYWIDLSSEIAADDEDFDIGALMDGLEDEWQGGEGGEGDSPLDRDEISDEGTHEVRQEQDVWVYQGSEEGQELVLEANHDEPKIVSISDDENTMNFTNWGETELPERPEESEIMDEAEFEQRMMEVMLGGL